MSALIVPPISGYEHQILDLVNQTKNLDKIKNNSNLEDIQSAFACALHMHQPTIPAGENGKLISHLEYMFNNISEDDNHNAEPFAKCYKRLAEIIRRLKNEGHNPKIMLDYSGNLLWGIEQMRREDILKSLKILTCDESIQPHVEWLGTFWSHAVASSTPVADLKLQISAWQHHFYALFGKAALQRVKGFSLPEMHLPNHPDALYELIKSLNECGYLWLLVQEHSVENLDGSNLTKEQKYIPNLLSARGANGETSNIITLIKTQGADTKLVGQMQPYYEALELSRQKIGNTNVPPLVSQIADGENGGVMMNEFPKSFIEAYKKIGLQTNSRKTVAINGTEYLELLQAKGINHESFPVIQAAGQHKIWQRLDNSITHHTSLEKIISDLKSEDQSFSMSGASWTNNLSWEEGYENVLDPMNQLSSKFHNSVDHLIAKDPSLTNNSSYQKALLYLLLLETSCFRYWGQGRWTDYAKKIYTSGVEAIKTLTFKINKMQSVE